MARSSAAAIADGLARVHTAQERELDRLGRAPTLAEQREMGEFAARHRQLFADLELSVPAPAATARPIDYRAELLSKLKRFSPVWRDSDLHRLVISGGLNDAIERGVLEDARRVAADRTVGSFRRPGALREIRRVDEAGQTEIHWYGHPVSWMTSFMSPPTMVERIVDPKTGRRPQRVDRWE